MSARRRRAGVVYVEFMLAFTPIFILFMGVAQLVMLFGARLVVHHATVRATRAAVVIADDDPRWYEPRTSPRGSLIGRHATPEDVLAALARGRIGALSGEIVRPDSAPLPSRRSDVEVSAALVLLPLAARPDDSIADAIGSLGLRESSRITLQRLEIDLPVDPLERDSPVTLRLRYRFVCGIPLARRIVCRNGVHQFSDDATLTNQGAGYPYDPEWEP